MPAKLELRDIAKRFDGVDAVRGLSMTLAEGEFLSLLGPSGCGKSTTLAMIAGFEAPTAGAILVDGVDVGRLPPRARRIGLVFQDYAVFSRLTVRANLAFGLAAKGLPRDRQRQLVDAMAERLQLTAILDRRGDRLNMSEMQRVALARVLVTEPHLVLLDEPMSNLDAALRASLRGEMKLIQKRLGQSILYVTHDQTEAMSLSDRIAVMSMGRLQQIGTPTEIYRRPANRFVAEFIGDPPINIIPCEVRAAGNQVAVTTARHDAIVLGRGAIPAGRHLIAIRPHDLRVALTADATTAPTSVRFIENLGAEHVLYLEYGQELIRAIVPPGFVGEGAVAHVAFDARRMHLIDATSDDIVRLGPMEPAG